MPFYVFREDNNILYRELRALMDTKNGAIYKCLSNRDIFTRISSYTNRIRWELSESDIVRELGFDPANHYLILDIPTGKISHVLLYHVKKVIGVTSPDWTTLVILTRQVRNIEDPCRFDQLRRVIDERDMQSDKEHLETLHIYGGYERGGWEWGPTGELLEGYGNLRFI